MHTSSEQTPTAPEVAMQEELRITGVRKYHKTTLKNISKHLGISLSDLMKNHFEDIIKKHPEHYRLPFNKD